MKSYKIRNTDTNMIVDQFTAIDDADAASAFRSILGNGTMKSGGYQLEEQGVFNPKTLAVASVTYSIEVDEVNQDDEAWREDVRQLAQDLREAFWWGETDEGFAFWLDVETRLKKIAEGQPIPTSSWWRKHA